jgi:hypothetical protein
MDLEKYIKIIGDSYYGYWDYLVSEMFYPSWHNYFWWLLGLSVGRLVAGDFSAMERKTGHLQKGLLVGWLLHVFQLLFVFTHCLQCHIKCGCGGIQ